MYVVIILIGFIGLGIVDMMLRKKYQIERNEKFMDQYISKKHFIVELWLVVMFLVFATLKGLAGIPLYVVLFLFFSVVFSIRTLLDYMYRKQSKRHITSFMYTCVGLIVAVLILLFG